MNTPVTTEEQAKQIACEYLAKSKAPYERCVGAVRTSTLDRDLWTTLAEKDLWIVYFDSKKRPKVPAQSPDLIIIEIDPATGKAEAFPTL
jgi:hypothetical protein